MLDAFIHLIARSIDAKSPSTPAEERFEINDHVVQTIRMLENLPLPKNMVRIPEHAGVHREALTATDRPYKKPKSLSEAVRILSFMCKEQHLDADLFELFLRNGFLIYQHGRSVKAAA